MLIDNKKETEEKEGVFDIADTYLCATKYITHDVNDSYNSIIQSQWNAWNMYGA
jgi:hypothetical protein